MSFIAKLKTITTKKNAPVAFYSAVGILFLILLPLAGFPPHIGLTAILSLITAYSLFKKRFWAMWLVVAVFFVATIFSLYTLYFILLTNWIASIAILAYAVSTWAFTAYTLSKKEQPEA